MKKAFFYCCLMGLSLSSFAQKFMQVTSIESIIPGGLGRSKIIITHPDGKQSDKDMKNFYSMVGINFENIRENEITIVETLNKYSREGWTVLQVTSGTQSPSEQYPQGIYLTRYLLSKPEN